MKLKGISGLEQHVEKIVVGAVGVGLLGVVGWQFLGQSKIQVGKGEVTVADAYVPVVTAAQDVKRQAESTSPTLATPTDDDKSLSEFSTRAGKPVAIGSSLPPLTPMIELGSGTGGASGVESTFAQWSGPAPRDVAAAQFRGTIQPTERAGIPELASYLPSEQPYDKAAVSVEATLNGKAIRAALEQDPDGAGPLTALPPDWWMNKLDIVGIEVEREEQAADGTWAKTNVLPALPGRLDFLKQWRETVKSEADASSQLTVAADRSEEILRPKYYAMMFGEWLEPHTLLAQQATGGDPYTLALHVDNYKKLSHQLNELKTQLAAVPKETPGGGNQPPEPSRRGGGGGGGGGGKGGGGGGGGAADPRPSTPTQPQETPAQLRGKLTQQIRTVERQLAEIKTHIESVGGKVPQEGDPTNPVPGNEGVAATTGPRRLLDRDDFKVFAHDITAEPGKTYRYRVRAVTNNPVFGREHRLKRGDTAQLELAKLPTSNTAWTDWSAPVIVDRDAYWFITSTNTDNIRQNLPTAQASLFQYYYGFYRKIEVALEPGDAIVGTAKLPPLWIYDEKALETAPQPAGEPREPRGRPGRGQPNPAPDQPANPAAPGNDPKAPPPGAIKQAQSEIRFRETNGVIFLDSKTAGGERLAVMRNQEGQIVSRSPEEDRKSEVFRRVNNSASAGVAASTPKIEKPTGPTQNPNNPPSPVDPPTPPGGGGGGGGGGG